MCFLQYCQTPRQVGTMDTQYCYYDLYKLLYTCIELSTLNSQLTHKRMRKKLIRYGWISMLSVIIAKMFRNYQIVF